jgi:GGDEF domain-containing protein
LNAPDAAIERLSSRLGIQARRLGALDRDVARILADRLDEAVQMAESAQRDRVTGLLLAQPGRAALTAELQRAARQQTPLAIAFVEVCASATGAGVDDGQLAALGDVLRTSLRAYDITVRWGPRQVVLGLPECGVERARAIVRRVAAELRETVGATLAFGCVEAVPGVDVEVLAAQARSAVRR